MVLVTYLKLPSHGLRTDGQKTAVLIVKLHVTTISKQLAKTRVCNKHCNILSIAKTKNERKGMKAEAQLPHLPGRCRRSLYEWQCRFYPSVGPIRFYVVCRVLPAFATRGFWTTVVPRPSNALGRHPEPTCAASYVIRRIVVLNPKYQRTIERTKHHFAYSGRSEMKNTLTKNTRKDNTQRQYAKTKKNTLHALSVNLL